jgi:GT2 family glycosyltransferase
MPQISIIILTYNSSRFIEDLLKSLEDYSKDSEILIVDNDSKDDTVKLAKRFSHAKVYETGKNLGFAKGINYGAKRAKGEYLLFINPDAVFKSGHFSDLVKVLEEHEKAGVVGGKLVGYDGIPEKSAGKFFNFFEAIMIILGLDEKIGIRFSPNKLSKVDFVSGGFMMVRSEIFEKLGGFDENFFMYVEDMELCFRVKKAGFETYFSPNVVISHKGQGSSNRTFAIINIYKGILYFYKKHKGNFEYNIVKFLLFGKAKCIYILGRLTNNDYYKETYGQALEAIK